MSSIICERSFFDLAGDLGIRAALSFKMADFRYARDMNKLGIKVEKSTKETIKEDISDDLDDDSEVVSKVVDDGGETNIIIVEKADGDKVVLNMDDPDLFMLSDDQVVENVEEACKTVKGNYKLIDLTVSSILYMTSVIAPEQIYRRCRSNDDLEIVNTIIKFYSGLSLTTAVNALSINEVINVDLLDEIVSFEHKYFNNNLTNNENGNIILDEIVEKTRDLIIEANRSNLKMEGIKDPDPEVPIKFLNKNLDLTQPQTLSKGIINRLEKEFGDILTIYKYQFNKINDLVELIIYNNGRMDPYIIDPGTIIGNGYNVICNAPGNDTVMVNSKHKEILHKVFANINYILTPDEMLLVNKDMFMNQGIYYMIDMSKGPEIFSKLSEEEFVKLGKKLSFVLNLDWNRPETFPMSRLRIRSFKSVNNFVLVSDNKCKAPLPSHNLMVITNGLTVRIDGDDIVVKLNDIEKKYHIDEYGAL